MSDVVLTVPPWAFVLAGCIGAPPAIVVTALHLGVDPWRPMRAARSAMFALGFVAMIFAGWGA